MDGNIIILFVIIWLVSRVMSSMNKKKKAEAQKEQQNQARQQQGQMSHQMQSADDKRRLREIYEANEVPRHLREQLLPIGQQSVTDDDIPPYRRQPVDEDMPPYKRLPVEELPLPAQAILPHHIDQIEEESCAAATRVKKVFSPKPLMSLANLPQQEKRGHTNITQELGLPQNALIQGIVMAEILGPPKAAFSRKG